MDLCGCSHELATPAQILALAQEYDGAARDLLTRGRPKAPASLAPARLCALHAIELYLNAYLLQQGVTAAELRGLRHDLARRGDMAVDAGLHLRQRTRDHLHVIAQRSEYRLARYCMSPPKPASPMNALIATLTEVAAKAARSVDSLGVAPCRCTCGHIHYPEPAAGGQTRPLPLPLERCSAKLPMPRST